MIEPWLNGITNVNDAAVAISVDSRTVQIQIYYAALPPAIWWYRESLQARQQSCRDCLRSLCSLRIAAVGYQRIAFINREIIYTKFPAAIVSTALSFLPPSINTLYCFDPILRGTALMFQFRSGVPESVAPVPRRVIELGLSSLCGTRSRDPQENDRKLASHQSQDDIHGENAAQLKRAEQRFDERWA